MNTDRPPATPKSMLLEAALLWRERRGCSGPMPAPAPHAPEPAVDWWLGSMTPRCRSYEDPMLHAIYARQAMLRWLDLPAKEREFVRVGVMEAGVPYRGEAFELYVRIWDETERMRSVDRTDYISDAFRKMKTAVSGLVVHQE